jgi:hypothetical protein
MNGSPGASSRDARTAASGRGKDDIDVVTGRRAGLDEGESGIHIAATDRLPCSGCGYMIRGGTMCGDCREYGPPQGWRWEYDPETGKHKQVGSFITPPQMP